MVPEGSVGAGKTGSPSPGGGQQDQPSVHRNDEAAALKEVVSEECTDVRNAGPPSAASMDCTHHGTTTAQLLCLPLGLCDPGRSRRHHRARNQIIGRANGLISLLVGYLLGLK